MTNSSTIAHVRARRVWDSRGRPTVEAEIALTGGAIGRAIAPAGASTGSGEAVDLRDGGEKFGGLDVTRAVANVRGEIAAALRGRDAADQAGIDGALIALDGMQNRSRLGGNAMVAVSMAVAHAAAGAQGMPLWRYLSGGEPGRLPLPEIQIFGGGAHAARRVDIQDFMVMCPRAASFAQALDITAEVYRAAGRLLAERDLLQGVADEGGFWPAFGSNEEALDMLVRAIERAGFTPGEEVAISLDIAASSFGRNGRYRLALEDRELDTDGMLEMLTRWIARYPIVSIEDPVAEDDPEGFRRFTAAVGNRVQVIGDDFLVTNAARVRAAARDASVTAVLIKPNQAGTLTETKAAFDAAHAAGLATIVSARSGETEDTTIVHLAVGWDAGQLKVGSFARSERMAKWNEALRIEEALGRRARFAGAAALGFLPRAAGEGDHAKHGGGGKGL
jgi:enolase